MTKNAPAPRTVPQDGAAPDQTTTAPEETTAALEQALGHVFIRPDLLDAALTHSSFTNERGHGTNYERLEFLGDAVLGLVAAHWLYARYPDQAEGELAKLKGFLVSAAALSRFAERLELGEYLRLGVGERRSGGRRKASILADLVESLVGAVYLDAGIDAARAVVEPILEMGLVERDRLVRADAKTTLQEIVQARGAGLPEYRLIKEVGPDHRKVFTIECWVEGEHLATADGRSKKRAEQKAASLALESLEIGADGP